MVTGTVKNWLTSYGFITGDDGKEYFVHVGDIEGADTLSTGQKVEFESESGPKGLKAKKVKIAGEAAEASAEETPAEEETEEESEEEEKEEEKEEEAEEESEEESKEEESKEE